MNGNNQSVLLSYLYACAYPHSFFTEPRAHGSVCYLSDELVDLGYWFQSALHLESSLTIDGEDRLINTPWCRELSEDLVSLCGLDFLEQKSDHSDFKTYRFCHKFYEWHDSWIKDTQRAGIDHEKLVKEACLLYQLPPDALIEVMNAPYLKSMHH